MKKKTKILHVTFDMAIGGTEQVIRQLVENVDSHRFESSILCIEREIGEIGQALSKDGIKITALNRNFGFDLSLIKKIRHILREQHIDILHCHQYSPYSYGVLAALATPVKVIFTEHGRFYPDRSSWKRQLLNPLLALVTKHITAISLATKQALIRFENLPEEKIQVIYNGISDLSDCHYEPNKVKQLLNIHEDEIVFGTIARLDPIKNHCMMLSAFKQVNHKIPHAKMLIVGDGPLRAETEQLCVELGIEKHVIFTGFSVEPQKYLNLMDVFLLPSLSEGTSMTLLEAMSFSKACIVTDVGGNPEIILDQQTGIVVPNQDQYALSQACLLLAQDNQLRKQYGQAGRKRFINQLTLNSMVESFERLYCSC